jgi:hypothetical protein
VQEKRLREELERLKDENDSLKKGQPAPEDLELTPVELEDLKANFPTQYKVAMIAQKQLRDNLQQQRETSSDHERGLQPPHLRARGAGGDRPGPGPARVAIRRGQPGQVAARDRTRQRAARRSRLEGKPAVERFAEAARRTRRIRACTGTRAFTRSCAGTCRQPNRPRKP